MVSNFAPFLMLQWILIMNVERTNAIPSDGQLKQLQEIVNDYAIL